MSAEAKPKDDGSSKEFRAWAACDVFCIRDYAGTGNSPCGWRGRLRDIVRDTTAAKLLCPRCGCDTLLRIPFETEQDLA